jgi:hypothetical protein
MEEHTRLRDPHLLELINGEADGSAAELDKSPYAGDCTHYENDRPIDAPMYRVT